MPELQFPAGLPAGPGQSYQRKAVQDLVSEMQMVEGMGAGRFRIAQVLVGDPAWGDVTLEGLSKRGMGGRETAIVKLAEQWAMAGHEVFCFVPVSTPHATHFPLSGGKIEWIPWKASQVYLSSSHYDVLVSWEYQKVVSWEGADRVPVKIIGMQVADAYTNPLYEEQIDGYVVLSEWAGDYIEDETDRLVSWDKIWAIPNGIDLSRYDDPQVNQDRRNSNTFFYSSSPDRGLIHLLRLWQRFRKEVVPKAELHVAYGIENWIDLAKWAHTEQGDMAVEIEHLMKQPGVVNRGSMRQDALAILQQTAALAPYPADTLRPTETGCITVTEAMAAGAPVVTTNCDCIPSEYGRAARIVDLPFREDRFLEEMYHVLVDPALYTGMQEAGFNLAKERTWKKTSAMWIRVMRTLMKKKTSSSTTRATGVSG